MPNPYFRFKQFTVFHDQCAMKVNTDGCLLGGWASSTSPKKILDIGAGSGVIALMLAQKYPEAQVEGVEIEAVCAAQCTSNFARSPFADRLKCHNIAIQHVKTNARYDLIVSNPPYFLNDTPSAEKTRHQARHQIGLSLDELFRAVAQLLAQNGTFCVILPYHLRQHAIDFASPNGLVLNEEVTLKPLPEKQPNRALLSFSFQSGTLKSDAIAIETKRGQYSPRVTTWLKPYYLNL